jgi:hypothetical protein
MITAGQTAEPNAIQQSLLPGSDEALVGRGIYQYRINARVSGISEQWTIHRTAEERLTTRAVRQSSVDGSCLEVAYCQSRGKPVSLTARLRGPNATHQPDCWVYYEFSGSLMRFRQWLPDSSPIYQIRSIPAGLIVAPNLRIFTGMQLAEISRRRGDQAVLTLDVGDDIPSSRMLGPLIDQRRARLLGTGSALGCYAFTTGGRGEGNFFWLDENDLCVRSVWNAPNDDRWEIVLSDVEFEP